MIGFAAVAIGAAVAAAALIRTRAERRARQRAEDRLHELRTRLAALERRAGGDQGPEWRAVLAHELRSALAAILGYAELIGDGTFGTLDDRGVAAARRIGFAADQLLSLIQALEEGGIDHSPVEPVTSIPAGLLLQAAAEALAPDADARGIHLIIDGEGTEFLTRRAVAVRTVSVALGAALKVSAGATLQLVARSDPETEIVIEGTLLDPARDDPEKDGSALTGAGLRLGLARRSARQIGGDVRLQTASDGTRLRIILPRLSIDDAEQRP